MILGSLVLHAACRVSSLDLPFAVNLEKHTGQHIVGRYNGSWTETTDCNRSEIYLPQRYKHLTLTTTNEDTRSQLIAGLEILDAQYGEARHLYKLNQLLLSIDLPFAATVNMASAVQEGKAVSGAIYLLSNSVPIYFALIFNVKENNTQLIWATHDFKTDMQYRNEFNYVFFPFPLIVDRPIFIHSQTLCAKWWRFTKNSGTDKHCLLRAANALELLLYKDPNVANYGLGEDS